MEKPGVIMSEAAFKMLLEALTGKQIGMTQNDDGVSSSKVENFLKGWQQHETEKRKPRDLEAEHEALVHIMTREPMRLVDIYNSMNEYNLWDFDIKQANQAIAKIMQRFGDIERVGRGLYALSQEVKDNE